jgi:hypothetical protein
MRRWLLRLALIATAVVVAGLASGCAVLSFSGSGGVIGLPRQSVQICASGQTGSYPCRDKGNIGLDASSGFRQLLLGVQIPAGIGAPATLTSQAPASLTFASSPGYAAELQRLQPAPAGRTWVGWVSPALNYDAANDSFEGQRLLVTADWQLPHGADGSPYGAGQITSDWVVGIRNVTSVATAGRPVACGSSLTTALEDVPDPAVPGYTYCLDSAVSITSGASDLGVVTSGARATGAPGSLVTIPFILRSGGADQGITPLSTRATSTLPGATLAVTPQALPQPPKNGDVIALVAVGIPAGANPGVYDVTFSASQGPYGPGFVRSGTGRLTVIAAQPGTSGLGGPGRTSTRRRTFATILPRALTVASALKNGIPVLIGSNVAGPAVVRFQQGPRRKPTVSLGKRLRLRAPGPVKATFRSRKLTKGSYRVSIAVSGKVVKTITGILVKPKPRPKPRTSSPR